MRIDLKKLSAYVEIRGDLPSIIDTRKIFFDSRNPLKDGYFLPLQGERFNGEDYIKDLPSEVFFFSSQSFLKTDYYHLKVSGNQFLNILAQEVIKEFKGIKVAITGTSGKTSTKEILAYFLGKKYKIHKTAGNFNNLFGVPFTILSLEGEEDFLIIELGTNQKGEIAKLSSLVLPDYSLITSIGEGHTQFLGGIEGVFEEKTSIFTFTQKLGYVVIDDEWWKRLKDKDFKIEVKRIQTDEVQILEMDVEKGSCVRFHFWGSNYWVKLWSKGVVENLYLVIKFLVDNQFLTYKEIDAYLPQLSLLERMNIEKISENIFVINDCYNANRLSLLNGLDMLCRFRSGKKFIILGDLLELSASDLNRTYKEVADLCKKSSFSGVYLYGENIKLLSQFLPAAKYYSMDKVDVLTGDLKKSLKPESDDDKLIYYFKASRSVKLERVIEKLKDVIRTI